MTVSYIDAAKKILEEKIQKKMGLLDLQEGGETVSYNYTLDSHKDELDITIKKIEKDIEKLKEVYPQIKEVINFYLDIPEDHVTVLSLWIIGTYMHKSFTSYPFIFLNAMKGSGKTRLLKLIKSMCWNGDFTASLTEAVLFRTASKHTMIIDEFEDIGSKEKSSLRELLNAGYKKGNKVKRMKQVKKESGTVYEVEEFDLYTPIAMANIWGMENILSDRCITLILERSAHPIKTRLIEDFEFNEAILNIKRTLDQISCSLCSVVPAGEGWNTYIYTTTLTTYTTLHTLTTLLREAVFTQQELDLYGKIKEINLNGRDLELYLPLYFIANLLGVKEIDKILEISKINVDIKAEDEISESKDISLIDYVSNMDTLHNFVSLKQITSEFRLFGQEDEEGFNWLNSKWIGRALKRLKLISDKRRTNRGVEVILDVAKAKKKIKMFDRTKEVVKDEGNL